MTKKKTKIKRNIKLSSRLHRIANFTSKSLNKAYIDYKHFLKSGISINPTNTITAIRFNSIQKFKN